MEVRIYKVYSFTPSLDGASSDAGGNRPMILIETIEDARRLAKELELGGMVVRIYKQTFVEGETLVETLVM